MTAEAVSSHITQLRRRALALARNQADAEDLLQDTLERALRALPGLRPDSNVGGWLSTLMNHRFIDRWRMERRHRPLEAAEHVAIAEPDLKPSWWDLTPAEIEAAMAKLPRASANLLHMRYQRRLPYSEIARRLGTNCDTVGSRLFRARQRLKEILIAQNPRAAGATITPIHAKQAGRVRGERASVAGFKPVARLQVIAGVQHHRGQMCQP